MERNNPNGTERRCGAISFGNAANESQQGNSRGWFVGAFLDPGVGLRHTADVEIKWGIHPQGDAKRIVEASDSTSIAILIQGSFLLSFPSEGTEIRLSAGGDYVVYAAGIRHTWTAIEDSVVLTVRWPSRPLDESSRGGPDGESELR